MLKFMKFNIYCSLGIIQTIKANNTKIFIEDFEFSF